jgi:hypothetical protein
VFVVYLYGYHLRLILLNMTTHESLKGTGHKPRHPNAWGNVKERLK